MRRHCQSTVRILGNVARGRTRTTIQITEAIEAGEAMETTKKVTDKDTELMVTAHINLTSARRRSADDEKKILC